MISGKLPNYEPSDRICHFYMKSGHKYRFIPRDFNSHVSWLVDEVELFSPSEKHVPWCCNEAGEVQSLIPRTAAADDFSWNY